MNWSKDAEEAVARVPFFVRKRVRNKVEEEASRQGSGIVTLAHVQACKQRFLRNMEDEVKGFEVDSCFGPTGCPNRAAADDGLAKRIEEVLAARDIRRVLKERVNGPLKMHHEFRVTLSDCPNACSRPQIADVGIIGACRPSVGDSPCSLCGACAEACPEGAVMLTEDEDRPVIDFSKCLSCGKCIKVCPSGTIREGRRGYRVTVGGKLGRHPQLGRELTGIFTSDAVVDMTGRCADFHLRHTREGERFGEVLNRTGLEELLEELGIS